MDPLITRATSALQPFLLLAPSANSSQAAIQLITGATSAPHTYFFAELLQTPQIQALRNGDEKCKAHLKLLEIFCWGTWEEYKSADPPLPPLTPTQTLKLQHLTLLTICTMVPLTLTYETILSSLHLTTPSSLPPILHSAISSHLLFGRLSPLTQTLHITSVAPVRDLKPGSIPEMLKVLELWQANCKEASSLITAEIQSICTAAQSRKAVSEKRQKLIDSFVVIEENNNNNNGAFANIANPSGKGKGAVKRGNDEGDGMGEGDGSMEFEDGNGKKEWGGSSKSGLRSAKRGGGRGGVGFTGRGDRLGP
ncbi:MAG: hypothetical protein M1834_007673 [Cirrosporium novae-zelandiae]|nr:MAG: hypothetical protein M1834_007673 [Cirrosporium novae-zelandiae]